MILAGDIGGTKTLLGVFDGATARPRPVVVRSFGTLDYDDLTTMIREFLAEADGAQAAATAAGGIDRARQAIRQLLARAAPSSRARRPAGKRSTRQRPAPTRTRRR